MIWKEEGVVVDYLVCPSSLGSGLPLAAPRSRDSPGGLFP